MATHLKELEKMKQTISGCKEADLKYQLENFALSVLVSLNKSQEKGEKDADNWMRCHYFIET